MEVRKSWSDLKTVVSNKNLALQYEDDGSFYRVFAFDKSICYRCDIYQEDPAGTDQDDFETNYKDDANGPDEIKDPDRKAFVVSVSRPLNTYTYFTTAGDTVSDIGGGTRLTWDFSNSDDEITAPTNYKKKRVEISFIDPVWIKEGTVYFHNCVKDSHIDFFIVCPNGEYYTDNDGDPVLATADTSVVKYVNKHPIQGSVPMGDELNTEATMESPVPTNYKMWLEVTVPDTDSTSNGCVEFEMYRTRTIIL